MAISALPSFPYRKILVIGATSGIGRALAERFVQLGIFVIAVGRRQENLDAFVEEYGSDRTSSIVFDVTKLDEIPAFAAEVTEAHPDLDCVFVNSGIQRRSIFSEPETIDMAVMQQEMTVNYTAPISMIKEFVPFFYSKKDIPTSFIFTSSVLAMAPLPRATNYSATKAALHHVIYCLREQLSGSNTKIIEIMPPAVQTELHDPKNQPDIVDGHEIGMPLKKYTDETIASLLRGDDQIANGPEKIFHFDTWEQDRLAAFRRYVDYLNTNGLPRNLKE